MNRRIGPRLVTEAAARHLTSRAVLVLVVLVAALTGSACTVHSSYEPFDSVSYLRDQYADQLGEAPAAELVVPFELSEELRALADERLARTGGERRRVDQVLEFVFGWLELEYALTPTRSAVGTFEAREGNCLSFVNLFVGLARERRLSPFYVEVRDQQRWNYREGTVISHGHIVAGLYIEGKLSTFDFLPYRPKSYRDFEPIDDLAAAAHYYNNLGAEALLNGEVERAGPWLKAAVGLAPEFAKAVNNLGVYYLRLGEPDRAADLYRRGLAAAPEDVALLTNLARTFQDLGRLDEAQDVLAGLEDVHHSNPFFYVYRGEMALAQGDGKTALDYMKKALRQDSELPDVHLGLAKAYLALGEVAKAKHHISRALRLDATHEEARRYAAMMEGPEFAARN